MITLKCLNKKDLEEFVNSGEYKSFAFLPITEHRALSQIKNPNAAENDILLTLAFEENELAGYLGTFPDEIRSGEISIKYAWLSTLYVSENFRGKRIAQQLLEKVFVKYENKIAITEFTKEAESLYQKLGKFEYITPKSGRRFYFRTDFETLIPAKKPQFSNLKTTFKIADSVLNYTSSFPSKFRKRKADNFEILKEIDEESENFIGAFQKNRSTENLRWVMKNPWILEGKDIHKNYQFSSLSPEFNYYWVKIFDKKGVLKTCALLQTRNRNLKISYLFSDSELDEFTNFLEDFIKEKKIKTLISYQTELNKKLEKKKFPKLYGKVAERRYLFHKELIKSLPENFDPNYQDGDGDPVFT